MKVRIIYLILLILLAVLAGFLYYKFCYMPLLDTVKGINI